jgi:FkbM family methyltransferase
MSQFNVFSVRFEDGSDMGFCVPHETLLSLFIDFYEKNELPMAMTFYEPEDRVVDCGAGLGAVSCVIAKHAGYVVAIEALPEMAHVARMNLGLNWCENSVIINGALVADERKTAQFKRRTLVYASSLQESHDEVSSTFEIGCIPIDDLVEKNRINCLHLDMEGGEIDIFKRVNLAPIHKIFFETHPYAYQENDLQQVIGRFLSAGFEPIFLGNPHGSSFPNQSCVMGFARSGPVAERAKERFKPDGIYGRLEIRQAGNEMEIEEVE